MEAFPEAVVATRALTGRWPRQSSDGGVQQCHHNESKEKTREPSEKNEKHKKVGCKYIEKNRNCGGKLGRDRKKRRGKA
jgi:hypothetical protein